MDSAELVGGFEDIRTEREFLQPDCWLERLERGDKIEVRGRLEAWAENLLPRGVAPKFPPDSWLKRDDC